jgi:hypothetical protein
MALSDFKKKIEDFFLSDHPSYSLNEFFYI